MPEPTSPPATVPHSVSLDGDWEFTYTPGRHDAPDEMPDARAYQAVMPVPGYWDDHTWRSPAAGFWSTARFNPDYRPLDCPLGTNPPDASLPHVVGVGWYRRQLHAPEDWRGRSIVLRIGGVKLEAWVWCNGRLVTHHFGHSTAFEADLTGAIRPGERNELILAVANTRTDRLGTNLRGWKGRSGGIFGPVTLHVAGATRIADLYVRPGAACERLDWAVELGGEPADGCKLLWSITDADDGRQLGAGAQAVEGQTVAWSTDTPGMTPWSDNDPKLYRLDVRLARGESLLDARRQRFGLRRLARDGMSLRLNGRAVFLRGATEHGYYPKTCTPPIDKAPYREWIARQKEIGFNWLRFHTSVPSEAYMQAADELGMMIQVEPPLGFEDDEWIDILRACRTHPSVVIYCCGNEELLDDAKIDELERMGRLCHELAPDALFNPHEALRGVEYAWGDELADGVREPYPHHPGRLERLKAFSDCFGQYSWGQLSYQCSRANPAELDERLAAYERPCLSHENGIIGNYINLDLAERYAGTRIGTEMFDLFRANLAAAGLLDRAGVYYRNSCKWARALRKHNMESARRCRRMAGYDFLGGIDCHWHRVGYPCGVLNEFYELKPDESADDVLAHNGESILLCDHANRRNYHTGETIEVDILASLFGAEPLGDGDLSWSLTDRTGRVHSRGADRITDVPVGGPEKLATVRAGIADADAPASLTLNVRLTGGCYDIANSWKFWAFPPVEPADLTTGDRGDGLRVGEAIDTATLEHLRRGGRMLLLGHTPLPVRATSFQPAVAGRALGNLATVIADHPVMEGFPHEGFCDWQFQPMIDGARAAAFNDVDVPFDPILEFASSFKLVVRQAAIFEYRVGPGRLLACTLNLPPDDPAAAYLTDRLVRYVSSERFRPRFDLPTGEIERLQAGPVAEVRPITTDQGFDANAQL